MACFHFFNLKANFLVRENTCQISWKKGFYKKCGITLDRGLPLFHCPMALTGWGHYWIVRDGFGGHVIHGLHQTFIPASNSTMDRGERPDSKGQWIESRQSVTSNRMNGKQTWSTTLIKPPPLLLIFQSPYFLQELLSAYCFDSCKFSLHTNSCYWPMHGQWPLICL